MSQVSKKETNLQSQGLLFMEMKINCRSNTCKTDLAAVWVGEYTINSSAAKWLKKKEKQSWYQRIPICLQWDLGWTCQLVSLSDVLPKHICPAVPIHQRVQAAWIQGGELNSAIHPAGSLSGRKEWRSQQSQRQIHLSCKITEEFSN